jgi:IS5 family transposase
MNFKKVLSRNNHSVKCSLETLCNKRRFLLNRKKTLERKLKLQLLEKIKQIQKLFLFIMKEWRPDLMKFRNLIEII